MEVLEIRQTPTAFSVNTVLDTVAVNLQNGKDSAGHISLRSAIMAANAHPGSDTIKLSAGTFRLTIAGPGEDAAATGDLDIRNSVTIQGKNTSSTIVDGNSLDRVFSVLSGKVSFSKLTIRNGRGAEGAGLFNAGGQVTLTSVQVIGNLAVGQDGANGANRVGGVITISGNSVGGDGLEGQAGGAAAGGGIFNASGSLAVVNSTIASNQAIGGRGGRGGNGAQATGANGVSSTDTATRNGKNGTGGTGGTGGQGGGGQGGGIFNAVGASLVVSGSTFINNLAVGGGGGAGGSGGGGSGGLGALPLGNVPGSVGFGGNGFGGNGGASGQAGSGEGGGLFNGSLAALGTKANTFASNVARGGAGAPAVSAASGSAAPVESTCEPAAPVAAAVPGPVARPAMAPREATASAAASITPRRATLTNSVAVTFSRNVAQGGPGGQGGIGGEGEGGSGGQGSAGSIGGSGGFGAVGGTGGVGGAGLGGGLFNASGAQATFAAKKTVSSETLASFANNQAAGGTAGAGGTGGQAFGGFGGNSDAPSQGGSGGFAGGGNGGRGRRRRDCRGGRLLQCRHPLVHDDHLAREQQHCRGWSGGRRRQRRNLVRRHRWQRRSRRDWRRLHWRQRRQWR